MEFGVFYQEKKIVMGILLTLTVLARFILTLLVVSLQLFQLPEVH